MKKALGLMVVALMLSGCGAATQSGFFQHKTMYKDFDHMAFSWNGYKNPTATDAQESAAQGWWGIEVPYIPGQ